MRSFSKEKPSLTWHADDGNLSASVGHFIVVIEEEEGKYKAILKHGEAILGTSRSSKQQAVINGVLRLASRYMDMADGTCESCGEAKYPMKNGAVRCLNPNCERHKK